MIQDNGYLHEKKKKETQPISHTIHKIQFQMDSRSKCER